MKRTKFINNFSEKILFLDKLVILAPKMAHPQLWIGSKKFLKILHSEREQQIDEKNSNDIFQKFLV